MIKSFGGCTIALCLKIEEWLPKTFKNGVQIVLSTQKVGNPFAIT
jgi:hypothetical protein